MTAFKAEFQPEAIALGVEQAHTYGAVQGYLRRLYANVRTELDVIDESSRDAVPYVRQFAPARAAECYRALLAIQRAATDCNVRLVPVDAVDPFADFDPSDPDGEAANAAAENQN